MTQASSENGNKAQILDSTEANIQLAAARLRAEEVVGVPSETVYGLAGDAVNPRALLKIFETKKRPTFDPLIVHVAPTQGSKWSLEDVAVEINFLESSEVINLKGFSALARERVVKLTHKFWPGPLTLVLPKGAAIPDLATSGLATVAVRMPSHPVFQKLLRAFGGPLAAPSANLFGGVSPTTAAAVQSELGHKISTILDGGSCEIGVESTILHIMDDGRLQLLRPGGVGVEEIERIAGAGLEDITISSSHGTPQLAPGLLKHHYAPSKPLILVPRPFSDLDASSWEELGRATGKFLGIGILHMGTTANKRLLLSEMRRHLPPSATVQEWTLSKDGTLNSAAFHLFATLREFDGSSAQVLIVEPPNSRDGLGYALYDRLVRASTPSD